MALSDPKVRLISQWYWGLIWSIVEPPAIETSLCAEWLYLTEYVFEFEAAGVNTIGLYLVPSPTGKLKALVEDVVLAQVPFTCFESSAPDTDDELLNVKV